MFHVSVEAPATVANVGAGFDCLAFAVDLWNGFELFSVDVDLDGGQEFELLDPFTGRYGSRDTRIRTPDANLFLKTFVRTRKYICDRLDLPIARHPCFVAQRVDIPPVRGLGSSASACVAGAVAACEYVAHHAGFANQKELAERLTRDGDADTLARVQASIALIDDGCPDNLCASLVGGLTYSFVSDAIEAHSVEPDTLNFFRDAIEDPELRCVALVPKTRVLTREARDVLREEKYSITDVVFNLSRATCLPRIIRDRRYDLLRDATRDRVHQEARARKIYLTEARHPIAIGRVFEATMRDGAYACFVGGAGSTLVALCPSHAADHVLGTFRAAFERVATGWEVDRALVLELSNKGVQRDSRPRRDDERLEDWLARWREPTREDGGQQRRVRPARRDTKSCDVFISHASADNEVARELEVLLRREHGLEVWYDEFELQGGDSLRREIDKGIASSRCGVVVLSPAFFEREWTNQELDGLHAREVDSGRYLILPVWHGISQEEVLAASPLLAGRKGLRTETLGIAGVARRIAEAVLAL